MVARTSTLIRLLVLLQVVLLQSVHARSIPKPRDQFALKEGVVTWDETCKEPNPKNPQETKRHAVERAWAGALELIHGAWGRFDRETWPRIEQTQVEEHEQEYIDQHDPAYLQFFALDSSPEGREAIRNILNSLFMRANAKPGENERSDNTELKIGCANKWMDEDGEDSCRNGYGTGSAAATESHSDDSTSTINFCPTFFTLPRFDQLKSENAAAIQRLYHNEKYMGTDALTVVHELTHLWWMGESNTEEDEVYGFVHCTDLAWHCGLVQANNPEVVENADTYAFYAEYGFWRAKGISGLWPNEDDPKYLPVENF